MGWGVDDGGAFDDTLRAVCYAGVFALVVAASPARSARSWLAGLAIGLVALSVVALGSRMVPSLFPGRTCAADLAATRGRLSYPLGYWNALGALLALGAVLLVALAGLARTVAGRTLATAAVPLPAFAVFLTSSRGGAVAGAVGFVVLLLLSPQPRAAGDRGDPWAVTGTAVLVLASLSRDLFTDGRIRRRGIRHRGQRDAAADAGGGGARVHPQADGRRPGGAGAGAARGVGGGGRGRGRWR